MPYQKIKAKKPINQEARRNKTKGRRKNKVNHHLEKILQTLLGKGNKIIHVKYVMKRIITQRIAHSKLS